MEADRPVVLITGADGFVGRSMTKALTEAGWHVRRAIRSMPPPGDDSDTVGGLELSSSTRWTEALKGVQAVIHLAALAHRSTRAQQSDEASFMSVNVDGTAHLARCAIDAGVCEFIFLSSIAVNGRDTEEEAPFNESSIPAPTTIYGQSKIVAEQRLENLAASSTMRVTSIRPPMIYGPGARGNFHRLSSAVKAGIPLPFGSVRNRRAFLGVDNLSSFVIHRLNEVSKPSFEVFLLADDEHVSTAEFVRLLGLAWGKPARIISIPIPLLRAGLDLFGSSSPLLGSLEIDTAKAHQTGWQPRFSLAEGLRQAAQQSRLNG
ncbi:MAG TPA: NAD-dependent epimerase/dehydratase family protein [Bradyrhizobium sp.]|nr:NAD-dependent epimerase/dehydratase family protein [Bradyrhizobium sp.]